MAYKQREVVEVNFKLPGNVFKPHPVVILSNDSANEMEKSFVGVMMSGSLTYDDFTFIIEDKMLTKAPKKKSQIRCHLIAFVEYNEVIRRISEIKKDYFNKLINHINDTVFADP